MSLTIHDIDIPGLDIIQDGTLKNWEFAWGGSYQTLLLSEYACFSPD